MPIYFGYDDSGNNNNWLGNGFADDGILSDSLVDVPTNWGGDSVDSGGEVRGNYCTWNPSAPDRSTLSNGNLDFSGADEKIDIGTIGVSSGKWYWEIKITFGNMTPYFGITSNAADTDATWNQVGRSWVGNGFTKNYNSTSVVSNSSFSSINTAGATIGIALDCDIGEIKYYVNNVLAHTDTSVPIETVVYPMHLNTNSGYPNNLWRSGSANFGQRPFTYTPPSGFKSINTKNLNQQYPFANGPDLVWIKRRDGDPNLIGNGHNCLYDTVRGPGLELYSDLTSAESTNFGALNQFTSNGFTVGSEARVNAANQNHVAWCWNAGSRTVGNTDGTITSTVRANKDNGFSIVSYVGNGSAGSNIGHGLGSTPKMIIAKGLGNSDNWAVYHAMANSAPATGFLYLNGTQAFTSTSTTWNNTEPNNLVFTVGGDTRINQSGIRYIAYCWAEIPGYSKFGSYTGNGTTSGPVIQTGFKPRYIMFKRTDTTANWILLDTARDTYNVSGLELFPNLSNVENVNRPETDILSNGFKLRWTYVSTNASSGTYVYAAFAESPFKYSLAR